MTKHLFDIDLAQKHGINEAIFLESMAFWTRTNAAKGSNFHQGRFWVYGTPEYFQRYFPYFTERQINYLLAKCVEKGLLIKDTFNDKKYDRTSWYSLSDSILIELNLGIDRLKPLSEAIIQNCQMDNTKLSDALDKIVRPIPNTKTNTKTNTTTTPKSPSRKSSAATGGRRPREAVLNPNPGSSSSSIDFLSSPDTPINQDCFIAKPQLSGGSKHRHPTALESSVPIASHDYIKLIKAYEEELPDNPTAIINKHTGEIDRDLRERIEEFCAHWSAISKKPLTTDSYKSWLKWMKEKCPGFCYNLQPNTQRRNGIKQFFDWRTTIKAFEGAIY